MKKRRFKLMALAMTAVMAMGSLAGCGSSEGAAESKSEAAGGQAATGTTQAAASTDAAATPDPVTLKILMNGDEPNDWEAIEEEFYKRTKDTLNTTLDITWVPASDYKDKLNVKMTAGEEYDMVFDAPWMHLRTLSTDGAYTDLSPYLNNDAYPGLKECFPESVMTYNQYAGINCCLPLFNIYRAVEIVFYRQDWAKEFGIGTEGQITSIDELQAYLDEILAKKEGVTPIALKNNRGFYSLFPAITIEMSNDQNIYQGSLGSDIFFAMKVNDEKTEVVATALPGDSAENWDAIGITDPWKGKLENCYAWNKYAETDSLNQTDPGAMFQIGKAGAHIDTIDAVPKFNTLLKANVPEAELGVFVTYDAARNMEKGVYDASVVGSNCLCIPSTSKNVDRTMAFLNWIFESQENHDLFELGIEGKHWEAIGDTQYKIPEGVNATTNYNLNGYTLTWNSKLSRLSADYTDYSVKYAEYAKDITNFNENKLVGFTFNNESVKTEITQNAAILSEVITPLNHGILDNPYETLQATTAEMRKHDIQKAIDEYVAQYNEFLKSKQ